jgi:hypothetical protein
MMTKKAAKYASALLGKCAAVLVDVEKFPVGTKEIPASLKK